MNCCRSAIIQQLQILTAALRFLVSLLIFDEDHGLIVINLSSAWLLTIFLVDIKKQYLYIGYFCDLPHS